MNGMILEVNNKFLDTQGYSKSDITSLLIEDLLAEESKILGQEIIEQTLSRGSANYEVTIRKKNHDTFPAHLYSSILEIGATKLIQCVLHDITERKKIETELYQTNEFLDSIIENIPHMVFIKDAVEFRFVRINKAGEELVGYSREDLLGKNDYDFFPKKEADFFTDKDKAALEASKSIDIPEEQIHTKAKGKRTLHTKKISVYDEEGNPQYLLGISEDITERKKDEEVLKKLQEELEQAVRERTADLTKANKQLRKEVNVRKKAEEAYKANLKHLYKMNLYEEIISTVTRTVHQSIELDQVLENSIEVMSRKMDKLDIITIYMVEGKEAVLRTHRGIDDDYIKKAGKIPYPLGVTWATIREGKPRYVPDVERDIVMGDAGKETGVQSYMAVPIFTKGKAIGVLYLMSRHKNAFDKEELSLLEIVAQQIENAINNATQALELIESKNKLSKNIIELSRKNRNENIVSTVTRVVHKSVDLEQVLENAVDVMSRNINVVDHVAIYFVEGEDAVMKAHRGYPEWFLKRIRRIPKPKGFTWECINKGEVIFCPDVEADGIIGPAGIEVGTKSYLAIPLNDRDKTIGSINVHSLKKSSFDNEDICLLEVVGKQIEIAINQSRDAQALRYSEERFRTLYQEGPSMYFTVNEDGLVLSVNRNGIQKLGYSEEELIGNSVFSVFLEQDKPKIKEQLSKCFANPELIFRWELRKVCKDGRIMPVRELARCIIDPGGDKVVLIACEDITERKQVEEALKDSEERHRTLVENSYDLIIEISPDFKFLYVSPNHKSALGYEQEELIGKSIFENIHPDDVQEVVSNFQRTGLFIVNLLGVKVGDILQKDVLSNVHSQETCELWRKNESQIEKYLESDHSSIYRYKTKNGKWIWLESTGRPFLTLGGELRIVISSRDVTERRKAQESLKEKLVQLSKKNRYESIIREVTECVHQSIDPQDVFENAVESMVKNIDGAKSVGIFLVEGKEAVLKAYRGLPDWFVKRICRIPYPKGFIWRTIIDGQKRYVADTDEDTVIGLVGKELGIKSYLSMPIKNEGKTVGAIGINFYQKSVVNEEELMLLMIVARQIETSINNAYQAAEIKRAHEKLEERVEKRTAELLKTNQLLKQEITDRKYAEKQLIQSREQLRKLATRIQSIREEEITRVAREIHDDLGQLLTVLKIELSLMDKKLSSASNCGQSYPTNQIKSITELIDSAIFRVQKISTELRPAVLDTLGLVEAIKFQSKEFETLNGIHCELDINTNNAIFNQEQSTAIFRILQESLTNVIRHAKATRVRISLGLEAENLVLKVEDNGIGIKNSEIMNPKSIGILGMKERVLILGGDLEIRGMKTKGTIVSATLPLNYS